MNALAYQALKQDSQYFENIGADVWLMDDHRWAFYSWQAFHSNNNCSQFSLLHADYHWDGVNDFLDKPEELQTLKEADDQRLLELVKANSLIRFDSFIAPAIIKGLIGEAHFYCLQDDGTEQGIDQELLETYDVEQYIHTDFRNLAEVKFTRPLIFDLCLDLFNDSDDMVFEGEIWEDTKIAEFLDSTSALIKSAKVVTVSLSFGYSGTVADTRHIASIVVPTIMRLRQ